MRRSTSAELSKARDYLAARFNERVSLTDAAACAGLSPFYFQRLFATAFNETPHEFVTRLRIDHAKKLLLAGNHNVTDICFEAGYESLGSFSTRFHSLTGFLRPPSGASRRGCSEHPVGTGRCITCPPAISIFSPECPERKIREVFWWRLALS
jgi:AraC-like DNA-binding protein